MSIKQLIYTPTDILNTGSSPTTFNWEPTSIPGLSPTKNNLYTSDITAYGPAEEADARRSSYSSKERATFGLAEEADARLNYKEGVERYNASLKAAQERLKSNGENATNNYAAQLAAAQQEAYRRQAEALQQQYELQKQREAEARAKQEAAVQKARDALTNAAQSNYDSAINLLQQGYDKNVGSVNTNTEKALQDAYISSMMQQRNLGQQLAAYGRSGGAAESTLLGLANAYGQQRGTLDNTRQQNLANLVQKLQENKANQLQTLNTNKANYEQNYQNQLADLAGASLERLLNYDAGYTNGLTNLEQQRAQALASISQR